MSMSMSALIAAVRSRQTTKEIKRLLPPILTPRQIRRAAHRSNNKTK